MKIKSVPVEPIIRQGILKYKDQVGQLWSALADYYIRSGCFEKVRHLHIFTIPSIIRIS